MMTITVPATYEKGLFRPIKPLKENYNKTTNFFITIEYEEDNENYIEKKDELYYKNIETSLNKIWKDDEITYSLNDIKNV